MSEFDKMFHEPVFFCDNSLVLSGKLSKQEAFDLFSLYNDKAIHITIENIKTKFVRFGFFYDNDDWEVRNNWSYCEGRVGAKKVWCVSLDECKR